MNIKNPSWLFEGKYITLSGKSRKLDTGCTNFRWPYFKHLELKLPSEQFNSETHSKISDSQEKN